MEISRLLIQQSLTRVQQRLLAAQEQIATGRRLLRPSSDPTAMPEALRVRSTRSHLERVLANADLARIGLESAESAVQAMSDIVIRARELGISGADGTRTQDDRDGLAIEVDQLFDELLALANQRVDLGYLFAGTRTDTLPFERIDHEGFTQVAYRGDHGTRFADLGDSLQLGVNLPGSRVFGTGTRGQTVYGGVTGAAAGTGTDSVRGSDHLLVRHVLTVLGDGGLGGVGDTASGLRPGGSTAQDTVLGPAGGHVIEITDMSGTGAQGTVSVDGGPMLSWTSADTDLRVMAPDGSVMYLDFSAITAGFAGSVDVEGQGTMSLDDGATEVAIDFSAANQLLIDSETGASMFVDSRGIRVAGNDPLRFPGTYDLFAALVELRDQLRNEDGLGTEDQAERIRAALDELDTGEQHLLSALSELGSRLRTATSTGTRAERYDLLLAGRQSTLEDTDFAAAAAELAQAETVLQATLGLHARIESLPSLLDFLA